MAGRVTGSRRLRAEGRADQATGNIKQAGAKIEEASRHCATPVAAALFSG